MYNILVSNWIVDLGIWPLMVVLVPNLLFRRFGQATGKKRMASLYQAIAVFIITSTAAVIVERQLTDLYLYAGIAVLITVLVIFRQHIFPYRLSCPKCRVQLDFQTIYFMDNHLCKDCRLEESANDENT